MGLQLRTTHLARLALLGCFVVGAEFVVHAQAIEASGGARNLGTVVDEVGTDFVITGGTRKGNNIFHSFSQFGIANGESATFDGGGVNGINNLYGRIETGPSQLNGSLRLQNWGGKTPDLMLLNPFGFVVGSGFSSAGVRGLSLVAMDALLFEDSAQQVVAYDLDVDLGVNPPDWTSVDFVGALAETGYGLGGYGQGGSKVEVNGSIAMPEFNAVGSAIDINAPISANLVRLFAQSFPGAFYSDPSSSYGTPYQSGSYDPGTSTFTAFNNPVQVGGVAPAAGFVSTVAQLQNPAGLGSCAGACPAGTIRFGSSATVKPFSGSSANLWLSGRQTVIDSNPLSNASSVGFTSLLGGGLYNSVIALAASSSSSAEVSQPPVISAPVESSPDIDLEDLAALPTSPPLNSMLDSQLGVFSDSSSVGGSESFVVSNSLAESDSSGFALNSGLDASASGMAQSQALTSADVASSLTSLEPLIIDEVARVLGLDVDADSVPALSSSDVQGLLRQAKLAVRKNTSERPLPPGSVFDANSYNPAVVYLRFIGEAPDQSTQQQKSTLELILITAEGEPQGFRTPVDQADFVASLRTLYAQLSRQAPLETAQERSASRRLYQQIFAPVASLLKERKVSSLLISADRGLQAVPYGALHDGDQFFGQRFALSLTPSLSLTPLEPPQRSQGSLLALGASKFDDMAPLPLVPQEIEGVAANQASNVYLNSDFTPEVLLASAASPRFSRVHIATHAEFLPGGPTQSRLHTGAGPVSLQGFGQIRSQRGDSSLDLFSLSACRTALGDSDSELGFAGLALQAGARSAIGSLWYVDDLATSAFFVQMYRYLDAGIPKAEAMQLTRRDLFNGQIRLEGDRIQAAGDQHLLDGLNAAQRNLAEAGFSHPYFWAGIQLLGSPW